MEWLGHEGEACAGKWVLKGRGSNRMLVCSRCIRSYPPTARNRHKASSENRIVLALLEINISYDKPEEN